MVLDASRTARLTGVGALCVAILYALAVPLGSLASMPASNAPGVEILRFLSAHREGILAAVVLNGIAWCTLMPAVFVGLRSLIGANAGAAATAALVAAAVVAALIGVALVFVGLAAYTAPHLSTASAKLLYDGFDVALIASAWPTLGCVLGLVVAVCRSDALPRIVVAVGIGVGVLHAINAIGFARAGAFSPSGISAAAAPGFAIWLAVIGVALLARPVRASASVAATA